MPPLIEVARPKKRPGIAPGLGAQSQLAAGLRLETPVISKRD